MKAKPVDHQIICPTCKASGFPKSVLGNNRCTFCDGTEGGQPPTEQDIAEHKEKYRGKGD